MRRCNNCGREFDDSVIFCPSCGSKLDENIFKESSATQAPIYFQTPAPNVTPAAGEPVSIGEWMVLLVNFIPCVGPIVYFIIMLVWAFGSNTKPSKNTFGKANLILYLVALGIIFIVSLFSVIASIGVSEILYNGF